MSNNNNNCSLGLSLRQGKYRTVEQVKGEDLKSVALNYSCSSDLLLKCEGTKESLYSTKQDYFLISSTMGFLAFSTILARHEMDLLGSRA